MATPNHAEWLPSKTAATRKASVGVRLGYQNDRADRGPGDTTRRGDKSSVPKKEASLVNIQFREPQASQAEDQGRKASEEPPALLRDVAERSRRRSWPLEQAAREADQHTQHAFDLAERGAFFSARAEFLEALGTLSHALETERRSARFGASLTAALVALRDLQDFASIRGGATAEPELAAVIESHETPVLKGHLRPGLDAAAARDIYLNYAHQKLADAVGNELAGSMALYGLGKLHASLAHQENEESRHTIVLAMMFHRASLQACPRNYLALNDLGVLLARIRRLEDAQVAFEQSLAICRQPENSRNLAAVYRQFGRSDLAKQLETGVAVENIEIAHAGPSGAMPIIRWIPPDAFGQRTAASGFQPRFSQAWPESPARPITTAGIRQCRELQPLSPEGEEEPENVAGDWSGLGGWEAVRATTWQAFSQGRHLRQPGQPAAAEYRLRVDDLLEIVYRVTRGAESRQSKAILEEVFSVARTQRGDGSRSLALRVLPEGKIALPVVGVLQARGLTVMELRRDLEERYRERIAGFDVFPVLVEQAPPSAYILGEVRKPGRVELAGPATVLQAVGLGGGWTDRANLRQVIVFRQTDGGQMLATSVDLHGPLVAGQPSTFGDIWLADSDIVVVPGERIAAADRFAELVFGERVFGVLPVGNSTQLRQLTTLD